MDKCLLIYDPDKFINLFDLKIFLTGFMGAGKTTLGKRLARKAGFSFIDLDEEIERLEEHTIAQIFEMEGEGYFRIKEAEYLRLLGGKNNLVIATGGGTPCYHGNMDWMNKEGKTVYLRLSPVALCARLTGGSARPLLKGMDDEEMLSYISAKLKEREVFYLKSGIVIDGLKPDIDKILM